MKKQTTKTKRLSDYDAFIASKSRTVKPAGFEPAEISAPLFDWQKHVVRWALRTGRAALFEDCGLGKTAQQLEWARQVAEHTGAPVLILTPLAVAHQTAHEAEKFGITAKVAHAQSDVAEGAGVWITNYEKLGHFTPGEFSGVVLDESSILKNFTGKTRVALTEAFAATPFRLCCTATPAPNDYMEFGQHAEFLGVMPSNEMLSRFFINDTMNFGSYRLKGHAVKEFWKWVGSWACCVAKPSDIGFADDGYNLPPLNLESRVVQVDETQGAGEELFRHATLSATTLHKELRISAVPRTDAVAQLVNDSREPWIVWCNTNYEADALVEKIPEAVEVRGCESASEKERKLDLFTDGKVRVMITKPSIAGHGLNWQHCAHVAFVGLSYSFEEFYQALRRTYRFGQQRPVNAYVFQSQTEGAILATVQRKIEQHQTMLAQMKMASDAFRVEANKQLTMKTDITIERGTGWELANADCVRFARSLADNSVDFSVYSPPFANLYIYSSDAQDMGNSGGDDEFFEHYRFLIREKLRITRPGCLSAVHCKNLVNYQNRDGHAGMRDFRGEIIRAHTALGWAFHAEVTIWKDPVIEMQRTKAQGLLYKQLRSDSRYSRTGMAEFLVMFRKWGDAEQMKERPVKHTHEEFPLDQWQQWASPVWMDVRQTNVLNIQAARESQDEKHICPLQLDLIERAVALWSNPGDLVYSPFAGIGSEGYQSLKMGRKFVGSELKESYFRQACANLNNATAQTEFALR